MPGYKPSQKKFNSKICSKYGDYAYKFMEIPSNAHSSEKGGYEDYNEHGPFYMGLRQEFSKGSRGPKEDALIHRNKEGGKNCSLSQNTNGDQDKSEDQQRLEELNAIRAKVGAPPLELSSKLSQAAQKHSEDRAKMIKISHRGSNGSELSQHVKATGINGGSTAENIAWNQIDWSAATKAWVNSLDHYRNMIDENYKYVGFGVTNKYYTEVFSTTNN